MSTSKPAPIVTPPKNWGAYMVELYQSRKPPAPIGTLRFEELEEQAREVLKDRQDAFWYGYGSAGTNSTYRSNLRAFDKYAIVPRMLVDATVRNLETTIFGVKHSSPLFLAPIGVQAIFSKDAELAPARAAAALGVPLIMSTASSRSIEEVAQANGNGVRWYQLYWPRTNEVTLSVLARAKASGFTALVITLDTMSIGWRPHDLHTAYLPFTHGIGVQVGTSDPVFMARHNLPIDTTHPPFPYDPAAVDAAYAAGDEKARRDVDIGTAWLRETTSGKFRSWDDLKFIRENWDGPLVLKGIQSVADAEKALQHGVDGIVVSNHGGRQVDGAIPSLYALETITRAPTIRAAQAAGKLTILFDSGIRTGSDIIKALALGAQAVLLGRPWLYGAVVAGQAGVEQVIKQTLADLDVNLGLSGHSDLSTVQGKGEEVVVKIDL